MNILKRQTPEIHIESEDNIFVAVLLGIGSIYALWLITGLLIAILS